MEEENMKDFGVQNPTSNDLILTNKSNSFENCFALERGLPTDF